MKKLLLFALLLGCSDQSFQKIDDVGGGFSPDIEVSPTRLDFGTLSTGDQEARQFTVTNVGTGDLHVSEMILNGPSFVLMVGSADFILPPDAWDEFGVIFSPSEPYENVGSINILSDDPDNSVEVVTLIGDGATPELLITPNPYDFGYEYVGCESENMFLLSNVGTEDLIISDITFEDPETQLFLRPIKDPLPITVYPGGNEEIYIDFVPSKELGTQSTLTVSSNDPLGDALAYQTASGIYVDWVTDLFQVPIDPPVDIIFAIDRSCSMDDDAASLAGNFASFISAIDSVTSGWKIGVVTADNGCYNTILESTTPNYETLFAGAVLSNNWGMYTESLLTVVRSALQAETGCNAGFSRAGAITHAVMVSDEPEQSPASWSTLVTDMQALVADPAMLKLSAVAGDYPTGCGSAQAGTGYYEAVMSTGGEFLSICSNWSKNVDVLALASLEGLLDFELSDLPDENTIVVTVDGSIWLVDWHYDAATNSIVFDTELPQGVTIEVEYGTIAECD